VIKDAGRDFQKEEVVLDWGEPSYVAEDHVIPRKPEFSPYRTWIAGDPERYQINSTIEHTQPSILAPFTPEESRSSQLAYCKSMRAISENEPSHGSQVCTPEKARLRLGGCRVAVAMRNSNGYSGDPSECQDEATEVVHVAMQHVEGAIAPKVQGNKA